MTYHKAWNTITSIWKKCMFIIRLDRCKWDMKPLVTARFGNLVTQWTENSEFSWFSSYRIDVYSSYQITSTREPSSMSIRFLSSFCTLPISSLNKTQQPLYVIFSAFIIIPGTYCLYIAFAVIFNNYAISQEGSTPLLAYLRWKWPLIIRENHSSG